MPAGKEKETKGDGGVGGGSGGANAAGRTTFRPPWVKEGPNPLPVPAAPWTLKTVRRGSNNEEPPPPPAVTTPQLRKTSKITVSQAQENGAPKDTFVRPQLKPVPPKDAPTKLQSKEVKVPIKLNSVKDSPAKKSQSINKSKEEDPESIEKVTPATRNALVRNESMRRVSNTPVAPPMPPPAPALPKLIESKPLSEKKAALIERLKSRPKTRPDWTQMLKEIEGSKKLKHVECNDRSKPLLPKAKEKGQFLYDSERSNVHNELLKQIQQGINLKQTKTNDRSKPILEGLRKFRRQMTIEEQIIKSQSMASIPPEEIITDEADEMDDIDKVRDDLQSTKQMLALELRNKEAQIRENKRLQARLQNLEAELEKERNSNKNKTTNSSSEADEKIINSLKTEAEQARKASEELEKKFHDTSERLDSTKSELEDAKKQNQLLEKKLQEALQGRAQAMRKPSASKEDEETDYEMEESDSDEEGTEEEKQERRAQRELKVLRNKLRSFKNKQENAKKERVALKEQMKKTQTAIKDEKKKFKTLQKEVDKMAKLMKDTGDDDEDEDDEDEKEEEDSESESESSESESEESDSDDSESEKSQSEPEDAPVEKKKDNLTKRSKRHENILGALKKGNYMLKTNVERLEDDLNKQKELTQGLQEDLDSVLAELG